MRNLLWKELLGHIRSSRFVFSLGVALLLMVSSTWVHVRDYEDQVRAYTAFAAQHARQVGTYETGADTPLGALSMGGRILDRRPPALAFLVAGTLPGSPRSFWVSAYDGPTPETNVVANRIQELFATVDYRFVIGLVFSLLALVLSYDAINGERAAGTLRLVFSQPVKLSHLLLAKWLGINAVLGAGFGLGFLLSLLVALASPLVRLEPGDLGRLLALLALSLLYLAVFVSLGLLLSCLFAEPISSIAVGLLVWVALVFLVPGAAVLLGAVGQDSPGYVSTVVRRQDDLGYDYRKVRQGFLDQGHDWATATRMTEALWRAEVEPRRARHLTTSNLEFLNSKARVVGRGSALARLSPYGCFSLALTELAGTGLAEQLRFEHELERYRVEFHDFVRAQAAAGHERDTRPEQVPGFHYQPASGGRALADALGDVGLLAGLGVLLFGLAHARMLRYDVR